MVHPLNSVFSALAWLWGVGGVLLLCGRAVWALFPKVITAFESPLSPLQLAVGLAWLAFMAYYEGYRGFQKAFAPRVVARARYLAQHPKPLEVLLAPLFCMGMIRATKRRLVVSWCLLIGVTALVLLVRMLPQPWRGLIDAGVVLGLSWGCSALVGWMLIAWQGREIPISMDLPADEAKQAPTPGRTS